MTSLIDKIVKTARELEVKEGAIERFVPKLEALGRKHLPTLEHSVRVGDLGKRIAELTYLVPPKALWMPGINHDLGKLTMDTELLTKTSGFNQFDMEQMKKHVEYGYYILLGIADFSAYSSAHHHYFKSQGRYPSLEDLNKLFADHFDSWSEGTKTLCKYCGRLLAVADFYDSATTRENDKFSPGKPRLFTREEAKEIIVKENQDQEYLINKLYDAGIFGSKRK